MLYTATTPTPPTPPAPPAAQGGYAPWYATTNPVAVDLNDNATIGVGISSNGTFFAPVQLTLTGLPAYAFATFLSSYTSTPTQIYLYTSLQTPPGTYTLTLTATGGTATTVTTFTLTVSTAVAPADPSALTRTTGRLYGIVRKNSPHGPQLRRYSLPVNPNTPRMSRWRHIFSTHKQTWRSLGANGANNTPTNDVDPQTAWVAQNVTYSAPRTPGTIEDNVQEAAIPGPLASGEAYMMMVQLTRSQLGLAPLPTPATTPMGITTPYASNFVTNGNYELNGYALNTGAGLPYDYGPIILNPLGPFTVQLQGLQNGTTAISVPLSLTTSDSYISGSLSRTDTAQPAILTVTLATDTPAGTHTVYVHTTLNGSAAVLPVSVTVGTIPLAALVPSPIFPGYSGMSVYTIYSSSYTVTGFYLELDYQSGFTTGMVLNGVCVAECLKLAASNMYKEGSATPTGSAISPIAYWPTNYVTPSELLTLWQAAYGLLPNTGEIVFQVTPYDPSSGCVGAALSASCSWEQNTLKGFYRDGWLGPIFTCTTLTGIVIQAAGTTVMYTGSIQGASSQSGWGGGAGVPYGGTISFTHYQTDKSTGTVEATAVFPTVTVPSGDVSPIAFNFTLTQDATSPDPAVKWTVVATDGISSVSMSFQLNTH